MASLGTTDNRMPSQYTLADFVEDNHKLLTVFGVFVAITTFANNLPSNFIGRLLSFFALMATVILGMELYEKFMNASARGVVTMKLLLFFVASGSCVTLVFLY